MSASAFIARVNINRQGECHFWLILSTWSSSVVGFLFSWNWGHLAELAVYKVDWLAKFWRSIFRVLKLIGKKRRPYSHNVLFQSKQSLCQCGVHDPITSTKIPSLVVFADSWIDRYMHVQSDVTCNFITVAVLADISVTVPQKWNTFYTLKKKVRPSD